MDSPLSASSKVFMKKSRMSDIRFVKQKKVSASANSAKEVIVSLTIYYSR